MSRPRRANGIRRNLSTGSWVSPLFLIVLAANGALFLPFLGRPGLSTVRWFVFVGVVLLLLVLYFRTVRTGASRLGDFFSLFLVIAGIRLLSAFWSIDPVYTLLRGLSLLAMAFLLAYFVGTLRTRSNIRVLNLALIVWLFLLIVPGIVLYAFGIRTAPFSDFEMERGMLARYSGILGNPNQIAICAAVMGPLVIASWMDKRRIWLVGIYLAVLVSIYLSGSRSGAVTQLAAIICVPAFAARRVSTGLIIGLILGLGLLNPVVIEEAKSYFGRGERVNLEEISANRTSRWIMGYESIKKRPIFGQGYGIGGVPIKGAHATKVDRGYPLHNSYLQLLQENGIVGTIPVVLLLGALGVSLLKRRNAVSKEDRFLFAGFATAFVCGGISAAFESWLVSVGNLGTLPFWICAAVAWDMSRKRKRDRLGRPGIVGVHS